MSFYRGENADGASAPAFGTHGAPLGSPQSFDDPPGNNSGHGLAGTNVYNQFTVTLRVCAAPDDAEETIAGIVGCLIRHREFDK